MGAGDSIGRVLWVPNPSWAGSTAVPTASVGTVRMDGDGGQKGSGCTRAPHASPVPGGVRSPEVPSRLGQCAVVLVPTALLAGSSQPAAARLSPVTCTATAWHKRGRAGPRLQPGKAGHSVARHGTARCPSPGSSSHRLGTASPGVQAKGPCLLVEQHPCLWLPACGARRGRTRTAARTGDHPRAAVRGELPRWGVCPARLLHCQVGKGRGAGSFPKAAPGHVVPGALPLGIVAASARPWCISCPSPTAAPAPVPLVGATDSALATHKPRCAADFTGLPGTPQLQQTAPNHCTPQPDAPQPGTPARCIIQHPQPVSGWALVAPWGRQECRVAGRAGVHRAPGSCRAGCQHEHAADAACPGLFVLARCHAGLALHQTVRSLAGACRREPGC